MSFLFWIIETCCLVKKLPSFRYLQSSVTSKFLEILLFTVDCHRQIYRKFASDRRLSAANFPTFGYWQTTVTSVFLKYKQRLVNTTKIITLCMFGDTNANILANLLNQHI